MTSCSFPETFFIILLKTWPNCNLTIQNVSSPDLIRNIYTYVTKMCHCNVPSRLMFFSHSVLTWLYTTTYCFHYSRRALSFFSFGQSILLSLVYDDFQDNGQCTHNYVVHGVLFLFLAKWMKSPHPFKAFPSYLLQTWCTWCVSLPPSPDTLSPAYFAHLPANESPLSPPASAAAHAWLDAILRHFWKEAWIRVPRSPCVYTHTSAGSNWVNEAESRAVRKCGSLPCILASHGIPTAMLPLSCSSVDLWTVFFHQLLLIKALTTLTSGVSACSGFCSGKRYRSTNCPCCLFLCEEAVSEHDQKASHLSHSVLFLLPCLSLRWNARSELFHLRVVDVHSGKESGGTNSVGGDEAAWGSRVACLLVNECSAARVVIVDFLLTLLFRLCNIYWD